MDGQTVRTVYATLGSVFPSIETFRTQTGDMLLMASAEPIVFDVPMMRRRMTEEPYRSALAKVWRVTELEGVFGHHVANSEFARAVRDAEHGRENTDDQNFVEFAFARSVGTKSAFGPADVIVLARKRNEQRPAVTGPRVAGRALQPEDLSPSGTVGVRVHVRNRRTARRWRAFATDAFDRDRPLDRERAIMQCVFGDVIRLPREQHA